MASIGMVLVGGACAALAILMSPLPSSVALAGAGQTSAVTSAVTTRVATTGAATRVPIPTTPTATVTTKPRATTVSAPGGQLVDLHGAVSSVDTSANTFIVSSNGSSVTVVVTASTTFQGDAHSLSGLSAGWLVEVKGSTQANGSFLAVSVDANSNR
ncbi:MAG TPA: DUF5666 domain-containing protein [Ktedonobacterales bacterium]|nr:DUF5666 domain-containing protein [Ktedonobacterales bacterium]